jgi:hypothetical protein
MAEQQPRLAEPGRDQLLEANRRGSKPPGKLRDKSYARLLDALANLLDFLRGELERAGPIDILASLASSENRQRAIPLCAQHQDGIDIATRNQGPKAVDGLSPEFAGGHLGPMGHLLANGADLESVGEGAQGQPMPGFPVSPQSNQPHPKSHTGFHLPFAFDAASNLNRHRGVVGSAGDEAVRIATRFGNRLEGFR